MLDMPSLKEVMIMITQEEPAVITIGKDKNVVILHYSAITKYKGLC